MTLRRYSHDKNDIEMGVRFMVPGAPKPFAGRRDFGNPLRPSHRTAGAIRGKFRR